MAHTLDIYQSLWAMERRIPGQTEEPVEAHMERVAEAGYAGACVDPAVSEIPDCLALQPAFQGLGLKCMVNAFPGQRDRRRYAFDRGRGGTGRGGMARDG